MAKSPRTRKPFTADPTPQTPQTDPVAGATEQTTRPESSVVVPPDAGTSRATPKTPAGPKKKAAPASAPKAATPKRTAPGIAASPAPAAVATQVPAAKSLKGAAAARTAPVAADKTAKTAKTAAPASRARKASTLAEAVLGGSPAPPTPLRIFMVASEAVPFAKTGGLADVVAALPKALGALGHDVTVVIPRYRGIAVSGAPTTSFPVSMGGHDYQADVFIREPSPGVRVALVDHPGLL